MTPSRFRRFAAPLVLGPAQVPAGDTPGNSPIVSPSKLVQSNKTPLRLVLRNISAAGQTILLAYDQSALQQDVITGDVYELGPGFSDVIYLSPDMTLYVSSRDVGATGQISISDARIYDGLSQDP